MNTRSVGHPVAEHYGQPAALAKVPDVEPQGKLDLFMRHRCRDGPCGCITRHVRERPPDEVAVTYERQHASRSGQGRSRTADTRIFSPLLYQLSYLARYYPQAD